MNDSSYATSEEPLSGSIQNPDLSTSGVAGNKAISGEKQAWSIFENLRKEQTERNTINAAIVENFNGRAPYDDSDIEAWQSNFNVLFLTGIVDKVTPVITSYIENAKWLTQSKLCDQSEEGQAKTNKLRDLFTSTVRQWPGWRSFCSSLSQELILIGYTFAARTDEYDWRPRHFRQDKAFVPERTPQFAESAQVFAAEQDFLIHELTEIIQDKEVAEAAKWQVENTVEAINKAMPRRDGNNDDGNNPREWADVIQEGNLGMSFASGSKMVKAGHVLTIETADKGKVTHYILNREADHKALLVHESRFDSMRDVLCLFTLDPGNGNFYGSRGLGRRLVNYSVAMNLAVNDAFDQLRVAGLILLQQDTSKNVPPPRIKRPFLYINKEAEFQQRPPMAANIEAFVKLIQQVAQMAEVASQQYVPSASAAAEQQTGNKTAHEAAIDYSREQQGIATFVARFAGQFAELIAMMQRAMCNLDTNDDEAKEFQAKALGDKKKKYEAICTKEELKEWANSPAAEMLQDLTAQEAQAKLALTNDPELVQSPMIDQKKRVELKLSAYPLPNEITKGLIKPEALDPNDEAEQIRLQQTESNNIANGDSAPISNRDNDKVHLDWMIPDMAKGLQGVQQAVAENPDAVDSPEVGKVLDHFSAGAVHAEAHVQSWAKKGATKEELAPYAEALKKGEETFNEFAKQLLKAKQARAQAKAQAQPPAAPEPGQLAQPAAPPPEPPPQVTPGDLVRMYVDDGTPLEIKNQIELKLGLKPAPVEATAPIPAPVDETSELP